MNGYFTGNKWTFYIPVPRLGLWVNAFMPNMTRGGMRKLDVGGVGEGWLGIFHLFII